MNTGTFLRRLIGGFAGFTLMLGLPSDTSAQQTEPAVSAGARVYGTTCGRCHNPRSPLERRDREWVTIANHMRIRGNLTGQQVRSVLAFLQATNSDPRERVPLPQVAIGRTVGGQPVSLEGPVPTDATTIARGRALIEQKACLGCHIIGGAGGRVGPPLNRVVSAIGAPLVRQKLADPTFDNATSMMPNFGLTRDQIEAIVAYLASLGNQ